MVYRKRATRPGRVLRRRPPVPRKTQKIRKLAGQRPLTFVERASRYAGMVGKVAGTVSQIAGLINSEVKNNDVTISGTGITNSGSFSTQLTDIAEGDDYNQRNGRFILSKHLQYRMQIIGDSTVQTRFSYAIIMDKKPDEGLTATPWTDVFTSTDPTAMINRNSSDRFIILKREMIGLNSGGNTIQTRKGYINLKGIHLKYDGTTSTSYDKNQIFVIAVSNQGVNVPAFWCTFRYEYYDN